MRTALRKISITAVACFISLLSIGQSIDYKWLNLGCASVISCDEGCTACNLPENGWSGFFGTNMIWIGPSICPYPTTVGDLSILSMGWPAFPENSTYGLLSGIATAPMQIDSIIIRHARTSTGPERLKVSYSSSPMSPFIEIADEYVDWNFQSTVITDLGCLEIPPGDPYATFQLKVQAYEASNEGAWVLDEIRIVGSPCGISTAVAEREFQQVKDPQPYLDVLGRPVGDNAAPGVYMGGKKVVTIF
ncbi:MAG: hypothetical protein M3R08_07505 [Bacteroidota bacterium]|nr:hypothetical protein [Bacteroidota bacterium]